MMPPMKTADPKMEKYAAQAVQLRAQLAELWAGIKVFYLVTLIIYKLS